MQRVQCASQPSYPMGKGNAQALRQLVSQLKGGCSECTGQAGTADCFHSQEDARYDVVEKCHVCGARFTIGAQLALHNRNYDPGDF